MSFVGEDVRRLARLRPVSTMLQLSAWHGLKQGLGGTARAATWAPRTRRRRQRPRRLKLSSTAWGTRLRLRPRRSCPSGPQNIFAGALLAQL